MRLDGLRLGRAHLQPCATGNTAEVHGAPADWIVDIRPVDITPPK